MTQQQRSDLLSALVSLEGTEDAATTTTGVLSSGPGGDSVDGLNIDRPDGSESGNSSASGTAQDNTVASS